MLQSGGSSPLDYYTAGKDENPELRILLEHDEERELNEDPSEAGKILDSSLK